MRTRAKIKPRGRSVFKEALLLREFDGQNVFAKLYSKRKMLRGETFNSVGVENSSFVIK